MAVGCPNLQEQVRPIVSVSIAVALAASMKTGVARKERRLNLTSQQMPARGTRSGSASEPASSC